MKVLKAYMAPTPDGTGLADYYLKSEVDAVIAELKQEIERLKKQSSCTFSDDCLRVRQLRAENHRLKRALWLKRADDAKHLAIENYDYLDCQQMTIKQENARTWMTCKLRTAEEWVKVWKNVERRCRSKAEEYK